MVATVSLFAFLLVAAWTDIRYRKVYNWTTYSGTVVALALSAITSFTAFGPTAQTMNFANAVGEVPLADALSGFVVCGLAMLVCYVLFPGGVGGGDVKLLAMVGSFLGVYQGLEALLWTFIFGGCQGLMTLIWRFGAVSLIARSARTMWRIVRSGALPEPSTSQEQIHVYLSPSALVAVAVVRLSVYNSGS